MGLFHAPGSAPPRRAFTGLAIAITSALAVLAAGCAQSASSSTPSTASSTAAAQHTASSAGASHFPATLLGSPLDNSADAHKVTSAMTRMFGLMGTFTHSRVALYGSEATGRLFIVGVADLTAAAKKYGQKASAASMRRAFLVQGSQDGRSFPAGAAGAVLGCGHVTRAGLKEITCVRYDTKVIGLAVYFNGSASSLSDAASKTNRAIAAIVG